MPAWKQQLKKHTKLKENQIEKQAQQIREKHNNLVKKDASYIILARKKGINLEDKLETEPPELEIENIIPEMSDVNLTAHVHKIKQEHNPSDKDYRVTSVVIKDNTGKTEISFWNEHSGQAQKLSKGLKLQVKNGYTKREISDWQKKTYGVPGINISDSTEITVYNNKGQSKELI